MKKTTFSNSVCIKRKNSDSDRVAVNLAFLTFSVTKEILQTLQEIIYSFILSLKLICI